MKLETRSLPDNRNEIKLEIPYEEFEKKLNQKINEYSKLIQLPGFRKGKVPRNIIINRFNDSLKDESLKTVLNEAIEKIYKNQEIDIYGEVEIKEKEINFPESEAVMVHLIAYKKPSCDIKKYTGLGFEEYSFQMTDEDFENAKNTFLTKNGSLIEVKEGFFHLKDILNVNVSFANEGLSKHDLKEHLFYFSAEKKGAIPDYLNYFYEELQKMPSKSKKKIEIHFPQEVSIDEFKNQKLEVTLELNSIKRIKKVEIDEAFLKKAGVASETEFNENLKKNLTELSKEKIEQLKQISMLSVIKKNTDFNIPPNLYQRGIMNTWESERKKYNDKLPSEPPKEWADQVQQQIKTRVENELILEKIKEKEEVSIGEEEMRAEVKKLAEQNKRDEKEFRIEIIKNGTYTKIKEGLVISKIFNLLYEKNNLTKKGKFPLENLIN